MRALLEDGSPLGVALLRRRLPRYDRVRAAEDAHWTPVYGPHDGVLTAAGARAPRGPRGVRAPVLADRPRGVREVPAALLPEPRRGRAPRRGARGAAAHLGARPRQRLPRDRRALHARRSAAAGRAPTDWPALSAVADEELASAEAEGLTGHPVLWAGDRAAIREDVERWLEHELADTDGRAA